MIWAQTVERKGVERYLPCTTVAAAAALIFDLLKMFSQNSCPSFAPARNWDWQKFCQKPVPAPFRPTHTIPREGREREREREIERDRERGTDISSPGEPHFIHPLFVDPIISVKSSFLRSVLIVIQHLHTHKNVIKPQVSCQIIFENPSKKQQGIICRNHSKSPPYKICRANYWQHQRTIECNKHERAAEGTEHQLQQPRYR